MSEGSRGTRESSGEPRTPSLALRVWVVGFPVLVAVAYVVLSDPWWAGLLAVVVSLAGTALVLRHWPSPAERSGPGGD